MKYFYDIIACPECGYREDRQEDNDIEYWVCPKCGHIGGVLRKSDDTKPNLGIKIVDKTGWVKYTSVGGAQPAYYRKNPGEPIDNSKS